ncbi:MAG: hypothetical protein M1827_005245 [Pycnora praestabilis]|nr:MAG: hypothetical protein M1827_005245 [Pycnora praestabilis]
MSHSGAQLGAFSKSQRNHAIPRSVAPIAQMSPSNSVLQDAHDYMDSSMKSLNQQIRNDTTTSNVRETTTPTSYINALYSSSFPDSQASLTSSSSGAHRLEPSITGDSQATSADMVDTDITPPNSSDELSNHSKGSQVSQRSQLAMQPHLWEIARASTLANDMEIRDRPATLSVHTTPTSPVNGNFSGQSLFQGQKRTASGVVKPTSTSLPTSPVDGVTRGHSRTTSSTTDSSGSKGELATQLRGRLSYAMVKVQNGWQSHSLDEIEALASIQSSPVSTATSLQSRQQFQHSPSTNLWNMRREGSGLSHSSEQTSISDTFSSPRDATRTLDVTAVAALDTMHRNAGPSPSTSQPNRTYESFWRDHSSHPVSKIMHNRTNNTIPASGPSLAPPVDIVSRNPRRSNPRPNLPTISTTRDVNLNDTSMVPSTPPPLPLKRLPVNRTPSQKNALEKDAVESLLFMSSPGNSNYTPHAGPATAGTPLRAEFGKKVNFADAATESSGDEYEGSRQSKSNRRGPLTTRMAPKDDEMDLELDRLDAAASSSDEDIDLLHVRGSLMVPRI